MIELQRFLRDVVVGLIAATLPLPERKRFASRRHVNVPGFSFAIGAVQLPVGLYLFMSGGLAFMRGGSVVAGMVLLENWTPSLSTTDFQGVGLLNWLAWFLHPLAWVFAAVALTGAGRIVAWAAAREALPEPAVLVVLRVAQAAWRRYDRWRQARRLGPQRPDRLVREPDGLLLLTLHRRPEWNDGVTIEVNGGFYRLAGVDERRDGRWNVLAYRLVSQDPSEVIRGLVHYEPR